MGRHVHLLSGINPDLRKGTCAHCGPVRLRKKQGGWRCAEAERKWKPPFDPAVAQGKAHRRHLGDRCVKCGFVPEHPCQLDVDHIDADHSNNSPENLQTLCANCHRLKTWQERRSPATP